MSHVANIILAVGVVALFFASHCRDGLRYAFDRWVEHRDHVAHVKHQQFEYVEMTERIDRLVAGLEPEKRQNSTVSE